MRCAARTATAVLLAWGLLGALGCEGSGGGGDGLVIRDGLLDARCTPVAGSFPPGFAILPTHPDRALLVQGQPSGLVALELTGERPRVDAIEVLPPDSDMDGDIDTTASLRLFPFPLAPVMGEVGIVGGVALVSTSNYEQILVADPTNASLTSVWVETPARFRPEDYPLLPPPAETHLRTGISTFACVRPPVALDSRGDAIQPAPLCDTAGPSFLTRLTAGKTLAAGHLFVATSNLRNSGLGSYYPGTVLVYDWEDGVGGITVRPDVDTPVVFTTGFNPTGVARHVTATGRELVLVTVTGAIGAGTGAANLRTESALDVIDAASRRLVASIPLGIAGPSFDAPALDPGGRLALLGASSQRQLYAVDLAPLDDPQLYLAAAPVLLDGLTAGFPDARIHHAAKPLLLPDRADGPPTSQCEGFTHVIVNAAGTQAFATDQCDGTLTRLRLDLGGDPPVPLPPDRLQLSAQDAPFAPKTALGLLRSPGMLRARPGVPGLDYTGPDILVTVGEPDAQLCALSIESP